MARRQSQGGSRGAKGRSNKPKGKPNPTPKRAASQPSAKVGSDSAAAKSFGGERDFGAPVDDRRERTYASVNTKLSDKGGAQPRAGEGGGGARTAGVGWNDSGPGSSSGGDLDVDFVGVAGGSGLAESAPRGTSGPDDSDGTSREFASGPPTKNFKGPKAGKVEGTTIDREGGDIETTAEGRGADAASRPGLGDPDDVDDSFRGEVSQGEASGQDSV